MLISLIFDQKQDKQGLDKGLGYKLLFLKPLITWSV